MGSVQEYKLCECGNPEMFSDYYYKTDELYESCDVCGYYHTVKIANKPDDGNYPEDWTPEYDEKSELTGYVIKIKPVDSVGYEVGFIKQENLDDVIQALESDERVKTFGITFKGTNGFYRTQLFKYHVISELHQTQKG